MTLTSASAPTHAYKLIVFDLDGTLVDTATDITQAVNHTLQHFGYPSVGEDLVRLWIGHGTQALLRTAVEYATQDEPLAVHNEETLQAFVHVFEQHYAQVVGAQSTLYPHVMAVLEALQSQGLRLALLTNKDAQFTHTLLGAHGLSATFDDVVCGDMLSAKKPDPVGLVHCMSRGQVSAAQTLFVGDSSIDVETARNAGVAIWAVPYGYNMGQAIDSAQPDRVIETLDALLK